MRFIVLLYPRDYVDNDYYIVLGLKIDLCCATWFIKVKNKHGYKI